MLHLLETKYGGRQHHRSAVEDAKAVEENRLQLLQHAPKPELHERLFGPRCDVRDALVGQDLRPGPEDAALQRWLLLLPNARRCAKPDAPGRQVLYDSLMRLLLLNRPADDASLVALPVAHEVLLRLELYYEHRSYLLGVLDGPCGSRNGPGRQGNVQRRSGLRKGHQ